MRIVTWEDAVEVLATLTLPGIEYRIRHHADMLWMREGIDLPGSAMVVHGLWTREGPGDPSPMIVVSLRRKETRDAPQNTGVAVFQATPDGEISMGCYPDVPLGDFMGNPNGDRSIINGDHPWLYGLAGEEEVEAGLLALTSREAALV